MSKKPNILFFFSDQQRWDTLGAYGQKLDVTPNLDKLAARGTVFENAFTVQPVCGPARAVVQTGKYATETGVYINNIALRQDEDTIAKYLNGEGYQTAYIGKWHLASQGEEFNFKTRAVPPERRGGYTGYWLAADVIERTSHGYDGYMFDGDMNRVDFKGYRVDCITDYALDFLEQRSDEKPFFLFLSFLEPHQQNDTDKFESPRGLAEKFKDFTPPEDLVGREGVWEEGYPDYLACCNSLDYNLGRVLEKLEKLGELENTVIIYTTDHGCHFKTREGEYKRSCHESSIRIPLIMAGPGVEKGRRITELTSLIDVAPTVLDCAGIDKPEQMRGESLIRLASDKGGMKEDWRKEVYIQISENGIGRAIRTEKWTYAIKGVDNVRRETAFNAVYREAYLYDLENDYPQRNNLVAEPEFAEVRRGMRELLLKYMREIGEEPAEITEAS